MSDFTGPGRNSEMSTIRSSQRVGWSFWRSSRWPGDSIWKQPSVSEARISSNVGSSSSGIRSRSTFSPVGARDLVERVAHRAEHAHAEDVELQVAEQLDVVLVGLDHAVAVRAALQRHPFDQVVARRARCRTGAARCAAGTRRAARPRGTAARAARIGRLMPASSGRRSIASRRCRAEMCGNDFATTPTSTSGSAERLADLADRRARAVRVDHRDAAPRARRRGATRIMS